MGSGRSGVGLGSVGAVHCRTNSNDAMPNATATFREFFIPNDGMRTTGTTRVVEQRGAFLAPKLLTESFDLKLEMREGGGGRTSHRP